MKKFCSVPGCLKTSSPDSCAVDTTRPGAPASVRAKLKSANNAIVADRFGVAGGELAPLSGMPRFRRSTLAHLECQGGIVRGEASAGLSRRV